MSKLHLIAMDRGALNRNCLSAAWRAGQIPVPGVSLDAEPKVEQAGKGVLVDLRGLARGPFTNADDDDDDDEDNDA